MQYIVAYQSLDVVAILVFPFQAYFLIFSLDVSTLTYSQS